MQEQLDKLDLTLSSKVIQSVFRSLPVSQQEPYRQAAATDAALHAGYKQRLLALFPMALSAADLSFSTAAAAGVVAEDAECEGLIVGMEQVSGWGPSKVGPRDYVRARR